MSTTRQPFHRPDRLEQMYRTQVQKLIDAYFATPSFATLGEINARLVEYGQANDFFEMLALRLANRMITQVAFQNAVSWREAARQGSKSRIIYQMLRRHLEGTVGLHVQDLVLQNAKLIKTLPLRIAERVSQHALTQFTNGVRSEQIVKNIGPYMEHLKTWEIRRIARTEVAKADTAITRARAENMGLNWYVWKNSHDARVRASHKAMENVLVNWYDTPSPEKLIGLKSQGNYDAGNIYNCRCVALPLVRLDQISFPAKCYYGGRIQTFSLRQFAMLSGMRLLKAA